MSNLRQNTKAKNITFSQTRQIDDIWTAGESHKWFGKLRCYGEDNKENNWEQY